MLQCQKCPVCCYIIALWQALTCICIPNSSDRVPDSSVRVPDSSIRTVVATIV